MKKLLVIAVLSACTMFGLQSSSPPTVGDSTSPTPEPATIGLMAVGMAGIGYSAWRQKRKK